MPFPLFQSLIFDLVSRPEGHILYIQNEGTDFLKKFFLFQDLDSNLVREVFKRCTKVQCTRGQVVYRQGSKVDFVYFIRSGEFQICRTYEFISSEELKQYKEQNDIPSYFNEQGVERTVNTQIVSLGPLSMFGHIEQLGVALDELGRARRLHNVKCTKDGEFYQINMPVRNRLLLLTSVSALPYCRLKKSRPHGAQ